MKKVAFIDMEGVLIPEIWVYLAEKLNIHELQITTREVPNYQDLMINRINILKKNGIRLATIKNLISQLSPLPNAVEFITALREKNYKIYIVSDCFYDFLQGFLKALDIMKEDVHCHHLMTDDGYITHVNYTRQLGKHEVIQKYSDLFDKSMAVGDAFNDFSMLQAVDKGFLFSPSERVRLAKPDKLIVVNSYYDILKIAD